ncbi:hypothetical protein LOZ64_006868, partial [Ophidiomyces ophidiicola]
GRRRARRTHRTHAGHGAAGARHPHAVVITAAAAAAAEAAAAGAGGRGDASGAGPGGGGQHAGGAVRGAVSGARAERRDQGVCRDRLRARAPGVPAAGAVGPRGRVYGGRRGVLHGDGGRRAGARRQGRESAGGAQQQQRWWWRGGRDCRRAGDDTCLAGRQERAVDRGAKGAKERARM